MLSYLVENTPRDEDYVDRLNTELKEAVNKRHEAQAPLASRDTELSQPFSEGARLTGELKKVIDGRQASESSLVAQDSDLAKFSNRRHSVILNLAAKCVKSSEASA